MRPVVARLCLLALLAALFAVADAHAQAAASAFAARLSPVPIAVAQVDEVTGSGTVTAVLDGTTLRISGAFAGLQSPATVARLHQGERTGVRGPAIFDLQATAAASGSVTAALPVSRVHIDGLRAGRFYVQISSREAPEGNLWGWLLVDEARSR